jgi:hypothetical protein
MPIHFDTHAPLVEEDRWLVPVGERVVTQLQISLRSDSRSGNRCTSVLRHGGPA